MDYREVTGRSILHLKPWDEFNLIHIDVHTPLSNLIETCAQEGIELRAASAFRSYIKQAKIWTDKAEGRRPLRDQDGKLLEYDKLSDEEIVKAILNWTAIPGMSRHHWGTDFDLYDHRPYAKSGDKLQLVSEEYETGGPNFKMQSMLQDLIKEQKIHFYNPFTAEASGHQAEPWHYSFAPVAEKYETAYSFEVFERNLKDSTFPFVDYLRANSQEIYSNFI